jgi:uncharacterized delta-60 repeat protein
MVQAAAMRTLVYAAAVGALVAATPSRGLATPGDFDPTFNGGAPKLLDLAKKTPGITRLAGIRVDAAGRIVVAGETTDENGLTAAVLARLGPDGAIDATFGEGGSRVTQAGRGSGTVFSAVTSLVPRPGGGWIVTGGASASDGRQAVMVLAVDDVGALDLGFGSGGSTRVQPAGPDPAMTLAHGGDGGGDVDADGSIVVAHTIVPNPTDSPNRQLAAVKLTPLGQAASGFGSMGVYVNSFSQNPVALATNGTVALAAPGGGVIVAGGTLDAAGGFAFLLLRLTPAGTLDGTFASGNGYRVLQAGHPASSHDFSQVFAATLGPGGAIYLAGPVRADVGGSELGVARYTAEGDLDVSFGSAGVARLQTASGDPGQSFTSLARAVAVQADGRVLVAGTSGTSGYTETVVVRLTAAGVPDPSFGAGGVVRIQASGSAQPKTFVWGAALASDGNSLLVAGSEESTNRGVVSRILLTESTTTTTVPPGCVAEPSLASALCRLGELGASVDALVPAGRLHDRLRASIERSTSRATASAGLSGGARKKSLKKATTSLARFGSQLRSKKARRALSADTVAALRDQASQIATILTAERAGA